MMPSQDQPSPDPVAMSSFRPDRSGARLGTGRRRGARLLVVVALAAGLPAASCATGPMGPTAGEPARTQETPGVAQVIERPATPLAERRAPEPANVVHAPALFGDLEWDWIGPARGGRVTAVTGVTGQPGVYYFGATGGGVWKTTDYGQSWQNLSDGWFETPSIGGIRVAESDPEVVWAATGSDGLRSNVITGLGVYRSTDAGETWRFTGLRDVGNTGAIEVDPRDPDVAYVAAIGRIFGPSPERGVYRTRDGGGTWEKVLFISDSTGIVDIEIDPSNPDIVYASSWRAERKPWTIISGSHEGGVYKSTDGGDTWTELGRTAPDGGGLPTTGAHLFGKIDLAVHRADPDIVFALIEAPEPNDGLWRSDDAGATWTHVSSFDRLTARAFYYTNVDVDPRDPNVIWVNAHVPLFRSTDGGESWHTVRTPHGDNHDIWIDPNDTNLMVQGNDGGANVSRDGGQTWTEQTNQPTAEMYGIDLDDRFPYWAYAGQQDNSAIGVASLPPAVGESEVELGCETGPAVPKPGDPDVVYNSCKGRFMVWHRETGLNQHYYVGGVYMYGHAARELPFRMQRVTPTEVSPHDPDRVYYGTQYVMVTEDNGRSWQRLSDDLTATPPGTQGISGEPITRDITGEEVYSTLYAIEESPVEPGVIWVGSYDGPFHVSRDNGGTWTEITPPDLPPGGRVQAIDPSPHDAGTAIYSVMRHMLDDWRPYVYRTRDYGESWERLTSGDNGIPADYPVRVTREDPVRPGLLYAGAEFGVYVSFDDGGHWQPLQLELPAVPVTDMAFAPGVAAWAPGGDTLSLAGRHRGGDLAISTMGRGFHILRDLTPLRTLRAGVARSGLTLHAPGTASLATWRTRDRYGGSGDGLSPDYGDPGATVDWVLDAEPDTVTVELLTDDGQLVNAWTSLEGGYRYTIEDGMRGWREIRSDGPPVGARAGHTRFTVPLRHPGPWETPETRSAPMADARGPSVSPGSYRLRVTADGVSATRDLTVVMDPRDAAIGVTVADLEAQESLALRVRDLQSRANELLWRVRQARTDATGEERTRLDAAERQLTEREDISYPQPMLIQQISYLYEMVAGSPQRPGEDGYRRYETLRAELNAMAESLGWSELAVD